MSTTSPGAGRGTSSSTAAAAFTVERANPTAADSRADVSIRPATGDVPGVLELARVALGWSGGDDEARTFAWKHLENPFGVSPMLVAVTDDRVVMGDISSSDRAVATQAHLLYGCVRFGRATEVMKPTLVLESGRDGRDRGARRAEAGLRSVALPLGAAAAIVVVALLAAGAPLPPALPIVGLVAAVAACVNRVALFSSELSTTGEAAVLFTAIVVFRSDAPLLGPVLVALFVGPADLLHWRNRSAVRMAYNAGTQVLAVLAGAAVYGSVAPAGAPIGRIAAAALLAAVPYVVVDSTAGVALLHRRDGEPVGAATRHLLTLNWMSVALAVCGGCAGFLADEIGWAVAALVLLGAVFAPELVLVTWRRWRGARNAASTAVLVVVMGSAVALLATVGPPLPDALSELLVLGIAGVVLELGFVTRRGATCLRALTPVVVSAAIVLHGDGAAVAVAAVAAIAVSVAAWTARRSWARTAVDTVATAAAACGAAALYRAVGPSRVTLSFAVLGTAVLAAVVFELASGLASWSAVRLRSSAAGAVFVRLWATSRVRVAVITAVSASLAVVWADVGRLGALPWAAGLASFLAAAPHRSRRRRPRAAELGADEQRAALASLIAAELGAESTSPAMVDAILEATRALGPPGA